MAPFGWAILIVWCTIAYASMEVPSLALPKTVSLGMVILSVALILFFSKPEGPVYKRLGKGLWAMYDITGVFEICFPTSVCLDLERQEQYLEWYLIP
jgi:V/A-type H+-transporting ATPase subunit I